MSGICCIVALPIQQSAAKKNTPVSLRERTVVDTLTSSSDALSHWLTPFPWYHFLRSECITVLPG